MITVSNFLFIHGRFHRCKWWAIFSEFFKFTSFHQLNHTLFCSASFTLSQFSLFIKFELICLFNKLIFYFSTRALWKNMTSRRQNVLQGKRYYTMLFFLKQSLIFFLRKLMFAASKERHVIFSITQYFPATNELIILFWWVDDRRRKDDGRTDGWTPGGPLADKLSSPFGIAKKE